MKTYLITGGAGFIGSHLTESLIEKNRVIVVDNFCEFYNSEIKEDNLKNVINHPNFVLEKVDITNKEELSRIFHKYKIDVVIHLAGMAGVRPSIQKPILYQEINCIGTNNILEAMREANVKKIIFSSSSSVYGNSEKVPFVEDDSCDRMISPYAATKRASELMMHVYHQVYGFDVLILRFFTVYGPRQRPDLAISKFLDKILKGEKISLYGDGTTSRDYTYVTDIIEGIQKGSHYLENNQNVYEIFNIGSHHPVTLIEMVKTIEKTVGKKAIIEHLPMQAGDVNRTYANIEKAKSVLGYEPKVSFEKGIENFCTWYKENLNKEEVKYEINKKNNIIRSFADSTKPIRKIYHVNNSERKKLYTNRGLC